MVACAVQAPEVLPCAANPEPPCDCCGGQVAGQRDAPAGIPAGVQAGEAWCRVLIPAQYEDVTEQVCVKPATQRREPIPAEFEMRTRQVLVRPAQTRQIPVPGEYEMRDKQVLVRPASTRQIPVPGEY